MTLEVSPGEHTVHVNPRSIDINTGLGVEENLHLLSPVSGSVRVEPCINTISLIIIFPGYRDDLQSGKAVIPGQTTPLKMDPSVSLRKTLSATPRSKLG
jgi:hypothetical protein